MGALISLCPGIGVVSRFGGESGGEGVGGGGIRGVGGWIGRSGRGGILVAA
eukprot:CAMPEP_0184499826 /NCGR_PEP_ID=MMETSP0113_2-20130426/42630_1 /TAXON_ID=91329 /ORGANISM="Norrisiella sphaerica, Strain BC52" /LENGTH=50 /DNA_ID=CAMNT_0026887887 /DNA_START=48 /DNA_END=200 /DNA_ORIENTATION=-